MFFKYMINGKESGESYESPLDAWEAANSTHVIIKAYREELDFYLPCLNDLNLTSRQRKRIERAACTVVKNLLDEYNVNYREECIGRVEYDNGIRIGKSPIDPACFPENMYTFREYNDRIQKFIDVVLKEGV